MTRTVLVVDDDPSRFVAMKATILNHKDMEIFYAPSSQMAKVMLAAKKWDIVLLDHDLGGEDESGYAVAQAVLLNPPYQVIVHSMNPVGALNIMRLLSGHVRELHRVPYHRLVSNS